MIRGYYSFANSASSTENPEDIEVVHVEEDGDCPIRGCIQGSRHKHMYISWHGNGYSRKNTWIAAGENGTIDLEECR